MPESDVTPDFALTLTRPTKVRSHNVRPSAIRATQTGNIRTKTRQVVVSNETDGDFQNVQEAINFVGNDGGGTVFIKNGLYRVNTDVIVPSLVNLVGESIGGITFDFGSLDIALKVIGTEKYSTGTISVTKGTTAVTGSSTVWTTNITSDHEIKIGKSVYSIASIESDTALTLNEKFFETTVSGGTYKSAKFKDNFLLKNIVVTNSTQNGIILDHVNNYALENVISETITSGDGISITTASQGNISASGSRECGGNGVVISDCGRTIFDVLIATSNNNQGVAVSDTSFCAFKSLLCDNNSVHGIALTSNCDNNNIHFANSTGNGGTGLIISDSTSANNIVTNNQLAGNTGASFTDSGTSTTSDNNEV